VQLSKQLTATLGIATLALTWNVAGAEACATSDRHVIRFYEYYGAGTPESANWFSQFRGVVDDELASVNVAINSPLKVHPFLTTEPSKTASVIHASGRLDANISVQLMSTDQSILELLDGWIQAGGNSQPYVVHSQIYILARPHESSIQPVTEDFLFDPRHYDTARSVHLAALYYALSIDAETMSCRSRQIEYLTKAAETLQDVHSKGSGIKILRARIVADQQSLGLPR